MKKKVLSIIYVLLLVASMTMVIAVPASAATTWYVANGGVDTNSGTSGSPFATIGHAVSVAVSGDTINVAAGTYTEGQIVIDKNLSIAGDSINKPVINPVADNTGAWILINPSINFNLNNVKIDGGTHLINTAIRSHGNTSIANVDFNKIWGSASGLGQPYSGIAIRSYGGIVAGGSGADSHGTPGLAASHLIVTNCTFQNIGRIGVLVKGTAATAEIINCNYTGKGNKDCLDYAFEAGASGEIVVRGCNITNCLGVASVDGSTSAAILTTTFYGSGTKATITGCSITGNTSGIAVGYDGSDSSVVTANNNNIVGNTYGITTKIANVNAENNWWGTTESSAIDILADGNVDFDPWLLAPICTVSGTMPAESISVSAPSSITFGNFVLGMNGPVFSTTPGSVTAFANTWRVNVVASGATLTTGTKSLTAPLQISDSAAWYNCASASATTFSYINNPTTLPFGAQQMITGPDIALGPGAYTITVTFTGEITN